MIRAFIQFCMVLNPTMCYPPIEIQPSDHAIVSVMECAMGGMMASAKFTYEGIEWYSMGIHCREEPSEIRSWLDHQTVVPDAR